MAIIPAHVARTAHDKDHVNTLSLAEFGVVEIRIKSGDKSSKSHRLETYRTRRDPSGKGSDDFCFAPGPQWDAGTWALDAAKTDNVVIIYDLYNPRNAITSAKLELFHRYSQTAVWTRELKDKELAEGEHELEFGSKKEWDGKIAAHASFPDEYVTVEHSPYKLKLTVEGGGYCESPAAWTYFHVIVEKLELEYGPKDVLPASPANELSPDHKKAYDLLVAQGAKPPASGSGPVKVYLTSNLFKTSSGQMQDNTLFTNYNTRWDKGAQIPLFCKIWVRDSKGKAALAPKALGKVKFLWDWESKRAVTGTTFVDQAQDYYKDSTKPKGQNCHKDRGGKRGAGADAVFPAQAGYAPADALTNAVFPFKVEACPAPRPWAAYSYAWRDKKLGSKTGVIFQPARMAGDVYTVTVYVAWDHDKAGKVKLNVDTDAPLPAPDQIKASTGTFEVWRRVDFIRYIKKAASVTDTVSVANASAFYQPAFLDLKDHTAGAIQNVSKANWNNRISNYFSAGNPVRDLRVDPAVDQHAQGPRGVYFRSRNAYYDAMLQHYTRSNLNAALGAALINQIVAAVAGARTGAAYTNAIRGQLVAAGWTNANATTGANALLPTFQNVDNFMTNPANGVDTNENHANSCKNDAKAAATAAFAPEASANPGCNLFHLMEIHNLTHHQTSLLNGSAIDIPGGGGLRCGFLLTAPASRNATTHVTVAHEFGHHFFLPHTKDSGESVDYSAHDSATFATCIMSYNAGRSAFCGFCRLRLRGWSKAALNVNGASNKKV